MSGRKVCVWGRKGGSTGCPKVDERGGVGTREAELGACESRKARRGLCEVCVCVGGWVKGAGTDLGRTGQMKPGGGMAAVSWHCGGGHMEGRLALWLPPELCTC